MVLPNLISTNKKGVALTVAIIMILVILFVASAILTVAYNFKRLMDSVGSRRTVAYYRAQAGVVDAQWRLRTDPGGAFAANGSAYDPPAYSLDIDGDALNDVTVDISAVIDLPSGTRRIEATGKS